MALKDSAPKKWVYREHTRVKHEILEKYLRAWIPILGKWHPRICYFDGFAGRGEYTAPAAPGSPVIAVRVAESLQEYFGEFVCVNIEKDPDNFQNLQQIIKREIKRLRHGKKIKICNYNAEFAAVVSGVLQETGARLAPSFFLIDPFGFSGVPFSIVKDILQIPRTEIFFTFMTQEINRFLSLPELHELLTSLYGGDEWRTALNPSVAQQDRSAFLRDLYVRVLREKADVQYVWDFRVCMDEKYQTLYYLIHATNNFKGMEIMKGIMYNQGPKGTFAFLGPRDAPLRNQAMLFDDDIGSLKAFLLKTFHNQRITYEEIKQQSYLNTRLIDKHYREALKGLEKEDVIAIERVSSKTLRGLKGHDIVEFPS